MAISSSTSRNQYTANGSNTTFAYSFKVFDDDDLDVYVDNTLKSKTTDYSVTGVGNASGGNIIFTTAPANGAIVTIVRDEPFVQEIEYVEGDDFPAAAHEEGLDRSLLRDLTLREEIKRTLKVSIDSAASDLTVADPADNAGKFIKVNAAEDGFDYAIIDSNVSGVAIISGDAGKALRVKSDESGVEVGGFVLTDGDKGDITVSSNGSTFTVDNDAITYAKMQNVSATDKILGRFSSGAGNVEEIDCGAFGRSLIDDADAAAARTTLGLASGTYTPTLFNTTNITTTGSYVCQYIKVGDVVTVSGTVDVDPVSATSTLFGMSLPIASNFTAANNGAGVANASGDSTVAVAIYADAANDRMSFDWVPTNTGNIRYSFTFTYRII